MESCETCNHYFPCKCLKNKKWEYFHICKVFANDPDGFGVVVNADDQCEMYSNKVENNE